MEASKSKICRADALFKDLQAGEFFLTWRRVRLWFHSGLQLIGWGPPTLWRAISFTQSIDLNVSLSPKHPPRNTQNNVWSNIWAPSGLVKMTHKINHILLIEWAIISMSDLFFFFWILNLLCHTGNSHEWPLYTWVLINSFFFKLHRQFHFGTCFQKVMVCPMDKGRE